MDLVVIRHIPFEDVGYIGDVATRNGHRVQYRNIGEPGELNGSGGLILMGGPMSVNDPDPWVSAELNTIEAALKKNLPVLGVCLGAQLIARALGQRVYRNRVKEIGWFPVHWRPEAQAAWGLSGSDTLFHWHGETFDLPHGAEWMAYSDRCAHQAFRYATNVYGVQFHPEVTPEMIELWCRQDDMCGDLKEAEGPIDPHANHLRQREVSEIIFGAWAQTLRQTS